MKVTNITKRKTQRAWKVGDLYITDKGNLKQIGYRLGHGYFVISFEGHGDWSTRSVFKTLDDLLDALRHFGMTRVNVKEIIVEEI